MRLLVDGVYITGWGGKGGGKAEENSAGKGGPREAQGKIRILEEETREAEAREGGARPKDDRGSETEANREGKGEVEAGRSREKEKARSEGEDPTLQGNESQGA